MHKDKKFKTLEVINVLNANVLYWITYPYSNIVFLNTRDNYKVYDMWLV